MNPLFPMRFGQELIKNHDSGDRVSNTGTFTDEPVIVAAPTQNQNQRPSIDRVLEVMSELRNDDASSDFFDYTLRVNTNPSPSTLAPRSRRFLRASIGTTPSLKTLIDATYEHLSYEPVENPKTLDTVHYGSDRASLQSLLGWTCPPQAVASIRSVAMTRAT
jgi:hypothetical protein